MRACVTCSKFTACSSVFEIVNEVMESSQQKQLSRHIKGNIGGPLASFVRISNSALKYIWSDMLSMV